MRDNSHEANAITISDRRSYSSRRILRWLNKGRYRSSTKMSRHGHHRVWLVLSMTLSNAEAISHMAYGMLYRTYTLCHDGTSHCSTSVRPSVVRELLTLHRAVHDAPAIAPEKKDEGEEEERRLAREKLARLEKRAVSPSMLLSRDKAGGCGYTLRTAGIQSARDRLLFPSAAWILRVDK